MNKYTCAEAFRRLDDYLDRELSAEEIALVEDHLRICAMCGSEFQFEANVLTGVRVKLQHLTVPESLMARINVALANARAE